MRCLLPLSGDIRRQPGSDQWTRLCRSVMMKCQLSGLTMCPRGHSAVLLLLCLGSGLGTLRDAIALSAPVTMANYFCTPHQYRHQHTVPFGDAYSMRPWQDYYLLPVTSSDRDHHQRKNKCHEDCFRSLELSYCLHS